MCSPKPHASQFDGTLQSLMNSAILLPSGTLGGAKQAEYACARLYGGNLAPRRKLGETWQCRINPLTCLESRLDRILMATNVSSPIACEP